MVQNQPYQTRPPHDVPIALSVIIPAFNAEQFLPQCLDSLLAPSASPGIPMEIIVIDDGSTDATSQVLEGYLACHDNIRVIKQTNRGVSVARNAGLAAARGEFVAFVDADDSVAVPTYGALMARAQHDELDMVIANAWVHSLDGSEQLVFPPGMDVTVVNGAAWLTRARASRTLRHCVWCHLYRREFLQRFALRFEPGISHSDIVWTNEVLLAAQRVAFDNRLLYHYQQRTGSLSRPMTVAKRSETARHYVRVAGLLDSLAVSHRHDIAAGRALREQAFDEGIAVFHIARQLDTAYRRELFAYLRAVGFLPMMARNARHRADRWRLWKRSLPFRLASFRLWVRANLLRQA
jgi:heptose III glucuronosyltransferase